MACSTWGTPASFMVGEQPLQNGVVAVSLGGAGLERGSGYVSLSGSLPRLCSIAVGGPIGFWDVIL